LKTLWEAIMEFRDRLVVVTGGTGALGIALVGALLENGATCHVSYRDAAEADRFPHRAHAQTRLVEVKSLSVEADVAALYAAAGTPWASIHLAGGYAMAKVAETSKADLMSQLETNFVTTFLCCREAVKAMKDGGRIVNVAARPALEWRTGAGMAAYTASKAAVASLTAALAEEVAKDGILVNAVAPSIMDTPANRRAMPKADFSAWPKVEEIAATILFLASPANTVTRGAIVPVYGKS
jgi:NAD(P)-dependent dehydrogenase (short-subunit alcohol dehydrogenase family)